MQIVGEGKTAIVYRKGNIAIKLYINAQPDAVNNEAERQTFAVEAGLPVPKVYGVKETDSGVALEMEYIDGRELVHPGMDKDMRRIAFEKLVGLQSEVHKVDARRQPLLVEKLARKIEQAPYLEKGSIDRLISRLAELDRGKTCLCHGDFHTSNLMDDGNKLWVIDWVDAACGDPLADACRSYLIFRQYISRMAGIYLRLYCELNAIDQEAVLVWLPVIAAARLRENLNKKEAAFIMNIINSCIGRR